MMPLELSDFPPEVQVAFFMHGLLSDRWDGASGSYLGKDWSQSAQLFELYEIDEPRIIMYFMKMYENLVILHRAEKQQEQDKKAAAKNKSGGGKKVVTSSNKIGKRKNVKK